jgi:hypothetical protein
MVILGQSRIPGGGENGPAPKWCPKGLSKTHRHRLQKMRQREIAEKREEDDHDRWFNQAHPMVVVTQTWREKHLAKEEGDGSSDSDDGRERGKTVSTTEECSTTEHEKGMVLDVNMVFEVSVEFHAPESSVVEMSLGAERAVFEKPKRAGKQMKPLFIKGHLNGKPVGRMMVDGSPRVNIMPWIVFVKLGHREEELK